jgi:hypothetical protein
VSGQFSTEDRHATPVARGALGHDTLKDLAQLHHVTPAHRDACPHRGKTAPAFEGVDSRARAEESAIQRSADALEMAIDARDEFITARDDSLRRGRGCRAAQVRREVGDGDVGLVANARNDWHVAADDCARDDLLVEPPEILNRAATPDEEHHIHARNAADRSQRARDIGRGTVALHARGANHQVRIRISAFEDREHVANGGPVERSDQPDLPGQYWQWPFARLIEQTLGREFPLQLLERELQRPEPARLERFADDLVLPLGFLNADTATHDHVLAVLDV